MKESRRNSGIDLLRVLAMLMVIAVHIPFIPAPGTLYQRIFSVIIGPSNSLFLMISGYFNLTYKFNSSSDWATFYKKRFVSIVIPYLIADIVLFVWSDIYVTGTISTVAFFKNFYSSLIDTNFNGHLWFVMVLIGLVLSTPILSKAVNNMDNRELNIVFLIGLVWSAFSTYGSSCWGLEFRFGGWIFVDCTFFYFLGFFCRRIVNCINKKSFICWE